jgi:hypothetical protein
MIYTTLSVEQCIVALVALATGAAVLVLLADALLTYRRHRND